MQSWLEIDEKALHANFAELRKIVGEHEIILCIKGNAYGHGMVRVAKLFDHQTSVSHFAITKFSEIQELRAAGIQKKLLLLSHLDPAEIPAALTHNAEPVIFSLGTLRTLAAADLPANIHLKIETGFNRQGLLEEDLPAAIEILRTHPKIAVVGLMSHFGDSDNPESAHTKTQLTNFLKLQNLLADHGISPSKIHLANSAGIFSAPDARFNLVRSGILLYGYWPSPEVREKFGTQYHFQPVKSLKTKITQIKTIPAASAIGYACTHITAAPTTIGILPVGYYEGLPRHMKNGTVWLSAQKVAVPILGNICMNHLIIDLSGHSVHEGDEVEILGPYITADEIAAKSQTINYEILTRMYNERWIMNDG